MMNSLEFIDLAERTEFERKDLIDWDDARKDILVGEYMKTLDQERREDLYCEAAADAGYCCFTQAELFLEAIRHNLYMILEDELRGLVSQAFMLDDEPENDRGVA